MVTFSSWGRSPFTLSFWVTKVEVDIQSASLNVDDKIDAKLTSVASKLSL